MRDSERTAYFEALSEIEYAIKNKRTDLNELIGDLIFLLFSARTQLSVSEFKKKTSKKIAKK
jgi:hypothetical protein